MELAKHAQQELLRAAPGQRSAQGAAAAGELLRAAFEGLQGVLAVEHRAIQQHLPSLWPLLWCAQAANARAQHGGARVAAHHGNRAGVGIGDADVHAQLACSLVTSYADLRQLELLLQSLFDSLHASGAGSSSEGLGAAAPTAVLCNGGFQRTLSAAVAAAPQGQVPPLLRLVTGQVPLLAGTAPNGQCGLLVSEVRCVLFIHVIFKPFT